MSIRLSMVTLATATAVAVGASAAQARIVDEQGSAKAAKPATKSAQTAAKGARLRYQSATEYFTYLRNP